MIQNPVLRKLVFCVGVLGVGAGALGAVLPIVPTVPFLIVSAWCFSRSSERAHQWLFRLPVFGDALAHWERHHTIPRRVKIIATLAISFSLTMIWIRVTSLPVKCVATAFMIGVAIYVLTRPEKERD